MISTSRVLFCLCLLATSVLSEEIPPDAFYSQTEMVTSYGYPCETHYALTEDGYNLTLFRLPYGIAGPSSGVRPAVILQHGLLDFSFTWILNMPNQSLAFILADAGFDVWLPNNRGNKESRWPTSSGLTTDDREWWQFSWDQMALYDVPGVINYVIQATGNAKVTYIGHSEGTTQMFAALVSRPYIASLLNSFIGFGPVAFANNIEQTAFRKLAEDRLDDLYELLDGKLFAPMPEWMHEVAADFCAIDPTACQDVIEWICGPHKGAFNNSRMPVVAAQEPGGTSAKNMMHWGYVFFLLFFFLLLLSLLLPPRFQLTLSFVLIVFNLVDKWFEALANSFKCLIMALLKTRRSMGSTSPLATTSKSIPYPFQLNCGLVVSTFWQILLMLLSCLLSFLQTLRTTRYLIVRVISTSSCLFAKYGLTLDFLLFTPLCR